MKKPSAQKTATKKTAVAAQQVVMAQEILQPAKPRTTTRKQKVGLERSVTRTKLLEAAEQLMLDEGYAAVTSRRLGSKAGVRSQLVHYYFPSMDDLFIAVFRHRNERYQHESIVALEGDQPLRAIWEKGRDSRNIALTLEFIALANHRKEIRTYLAEARERFRRLQQASLEKYLERRGIRPEISAGAMSFLLTSIGLLLALESQIGASYVRDEVETLVESVLQQFEATGRIRPG